MTEQKPKMKLPTLDDYLMPNGEIKIDKDDSLVNIPIKLIKDFPNHPFKVKDDEKMNDLVESVKENGVLYPLLVRPRSDGTYELISGHRRKRAAQKLNIDSVKCIVKDLTDDEATILMVDSNIQREEVLPSEKAFAYKMKLGAIKHQGKRNDLTSFQVGNKLSGKTSAEIIADETGNSKTNIYRYIRLTELIKPLLQLVDDNKMALSPAVEISYLKEQEQKDLLETIESEDCTPSYSQAIRMKELSRQNKLDMDTIFNIMTEQKPNQKEQIKFKVENLKGYFPKGYSTKQMEDVIENLLKQYKQRWKSRELGR